MFKIIDETGDQTFDPIIVKSNVGHLYMYAKDHKSKKICYINLRNGMKFDTEYTTIEEALGGGITKTENGSINVRATQKEIDAVLTIK